MTPLEDRVVPAVVNVSGLRFEIPGNFTTSAVGGGTKYDTVETVKVGLAPQAPAAFVPLFTLDGGGSVTDTGISSSPFTWNSGVSAVTSGAALPLFAGKADTQTVADTLPAVAAAAAHANGQAVPVGPFTLTPSGFRISSADKLALAGSLGIADFGGIKLADVALGKFVTAPADAGATFSTATVEGGFQLGANGGFNVGGLTFKAGANASQPNVGGYVRITTATGQVEVAGQAKVTLAGNPVDISSGQYDGNDATKFVAGAVFLGGVAQKFDLKATADVKLGGLTFTAQNLLGTYDRPTSTFTLKGTAGLALKGNTVAVNFGDGTTAGLTVANGTVTNAAFTANSTLKLGGLTFKGKALTATFDNASNTYTLKGTAEFDLKGNAVAVNFGDATTAGLVIADGTVTNAAFTVNTDVKLGGLTFKAVNLASTYTDATSTYAIRGGASFDLNGNTVGVTLGGKATAGLVLTGGTVTSADFNVDAKIIVGGLTFTATDLRATYADASNTYTLKGAATFALKDSTVAVTFGDKTTAGLVIANGLVTSADFAVDAKVVVGGLTFTATDLRATYSPANSGTYTLKGTAGFTLEGSAVAVTVGDGKAAGLVVTNGAVTSFDFTVNSKVVVGGLAITAKDLRATYTDADSKFTLAGTAAAAIAGLGTVNVTLGGAADKPGLVLTGGSLTSLDATVNSDVTVSGVKLTTTGLNLTYTAATSLYTLTGSATAAISGLGTLNLTFGSATRPGAVIQNGALVSLDATVGAEFTVAKVAIKATAVRLIYTAATTQFTLAGTAEATITGIGTVNLTFGSGSKPGLVVQEGALALLDATLNSDITVSAVKFTTTGLNLTYTAATAQFTLTGSATATVTGIGTVNLTFGYPGKPGLVIQEGSLTSLDVTLNSDITVAKVRLTTAGLNLAYTAKDGGTFNLTGPATATIAGVGVVGLTFGSATKPGLVVKAGALVSLDTTLTSDITVSGVKITTTGLDLAYTAADSKFTLAGAATAAIAGLGTLNLTFGSGTKPGLVVTDGALTSLDVTLNSDVTVSGVKITTTGLNLTYTAATSLFTLAGDAKATVTGLGELNATFGFAGKPGLVVQNGSLVTLDVTLNSDLEVAKVKITTTWLRLTYTAATNQFTLAGAAKATVTGLGELGVTFGYQGNPGLVLQDGTLAFLDLTLTANLTVASVAVTATGLRLTYTAATSTFTLAGSAQATIQKLGTVGVTFGFQGKPGLVVKDGALTNLDVTLTSDLTISNIRVVTTGLELSYTAADSKFTLTGTTTITTPQLGTINVTFGYDGKPGLVVQNGALVSLDLRINSNFTFLKYNFTVENLDLSYSADTAKFTVRGKASVDLLLGTFAIQLGDGNGGQGIVITNGKVTSIDATVRGEVKVSYVSLGQVELSLKYDGTTGIFEITGKADITLAISLPSPANLFLKGPAFHVGVVQVEVRVVPGDNPNSFTKFSARTTSGNSYTLKITFSGDVTSDGLTQAAFDSLKDAASNAAKSVAKTVVNVAKSAFRSARRFFGGRDNELSGATVFYDLNNNRVLDPGELSAVLGEDGTAPQLAITAGVGQLVVFGGTNVGTNLPNQLVLTAPADATKASPMSTLVQAIRAAQAGDNQPDLSVADATVYVEVALGVPGAVDPLNDDVIQAAVGGSTSAAKAFAADVEVATLAKGVSALVGEAGADGAAAFAALASLIVSTGGPIDLSDAAVVARLVRDAATRLRVTLDPAVIDGGAAVIAGVVARMKAIPAADGTAFVRELAKIQKAANNDAFPKLAAAEAGTADIAAVVAAQTGAAFAAEVADETVGVLSAATSNASPLYAIGAGPGGGPMVRVYDRQTNAVVSSFFAFDPKFTGGVSVAVGDVTGDGVPDVVVAAGAGGHARVIVIDGTKLNAVAADGQIDPSALVASFFGFEAGFTGGATLALARLDSSPGLNVVVGAGAGGGPRVRTFNWTPGVAGGVTQLGGKIGDFFAFDPAARVGVNVAAGDLDGLGRDDLIIGAGVGGGPVVAIYLPDGTLRDLFFTGDSTLRGGVSVAAGFLDGGSTAQLVTASGPGSPTVVKVYQGADLTLERSAPVFGADITGGASVAVGPTDDGDVQVVVGAGPGGGPRVGVLAADDLRSVGDFFGFDLGFRGGVNVG